MPVLAAYRAEMPGMRLTACHPLPAARRRGRSSSTKPAAGCLHPAAFAALRRRSRPPEVPALLPRDIPSAACLDVSCTHTALVDGAQPLRLVIQPWHGSIYKGQNSFSGSHSPKIYSRAPKEIRSMSRMRSTRFVALLTRYSSLVLSS